MPIAGVSVSSQPAQLTSGHEKPQGLMKILKGVVGVVGKIWCLEKQTSIPQPFHTSLYHTCGNVDPILINPD